MTPLRQTMRIYHKFKAKPQNVDGIHFPSKKEAKRYNELLLLKKSGDILFFLRQVPFHLPGNVKYVCDFQIFWKDGSVTFEDVKGMSTPTYITKKKMVENLYPIKISEV
jgi:hypothetical protein